MDYVSENHSKHMLMTHLILVCRYRKKLLVYFGNQIKNIFRDIASENGFKIIEMEQDKDHIHVLLQYHLKQSISSIVRLLKQVSTYRIWRQNNNEEYLSKEFWSTKNFWSSGYFACSIGQVSKHTIEQYIRNQG